MSVDPRAARWAAIDSAALWAPVRPHFPSRPARVLEVGAGSGRDAAWFSGLGYRVTCVEPDRSLWPNSADWLADGLPSLKDVGGAFDLVTIAAVWHFVPEAQWEASFERLAEVTEPGGRLILSLRVPPLRGANVVVPLAEKSGWQLCDVCRQPSVQAGNRAAGVTWDWCVFARVVCG